MGSRDGDGTSSHAQGSPKKKKEKNGTPKTKKQKTPASKLGHQVHEIGDVELQTDVHVHSKPLPQKIQVKPKSIGGTSTITVDNATSDSGAASATDNTGGFASVQYGTLLETKRAEKLCSSFGLQKRHVVAMHRAFKREEQLGTGEITTGEFFKMSREHPRQLTKGLFEAVGLARDIKRLCFDDFVISVATIATWSKGELLHYAFKQFDVDESGLMDSRELRAFCEGLKNDSSFYFAKNVNTAREKLVARDRKNLNNQGSAKQLQISNDIEDNTLVDLEDLVKGSTEFQVAFYPLMQLQQNVRACALGEQFWAGVTTRRQHVEAIVQYMGLHKGKLPPTSITTRVMALIPFSQANTKVLVHKLAVLKYAEEQRLLQDQSKARAKTKQALRLTQCQEENQTYPDFESAK
ncbi:hypothetical protein PHYPSEUDO_000868 [Phytophthora pseudosyringae]|uniref:EF-hand domain-containing protein n=1 Tax=Phytophthora pseudosyringae TaxID=221518 RepID=A0A8T1W1K1_9STRA|nr:hypothetical protein PHYPSEUDO_000868 [Phytophthora pseudosyringae]